MFLDNSTNFTSSCQIPLPTIELKYKRFKSSSKFFWDLKLNNQIQPTNSLRQIILENVSPLRITASAGTQFDRTLKKKSYSILDDRLYS